ncbi:MAG: hypothetical protein UX08_C0002G0012 [Candidatus Collierbacteria bacterium GW2011_GWB1_45_35]|uniref:CHAT domain-containing protein n=2 Tax=Candidatus Collieribacteriota TaxID=1752725 RepID=A0A0G1KR00_9BACT|nr:MAG: hypothetical protein UW48_C0004G0022 [Microgenomates group bacterium GW2011_GWC1_44_23]KKT85988.1 MAG: hypothetical protein UW84_C0018G0012 [Candidatus Collierbacteria bacterium GW2011_GWA2_44_99]KKT95698.1 MAG: hypothetical protein UW96_C0005G0022 [Candidatus Collierbacteria bacterium GW2011_GWA1_45_15]KKU00345.1 MAG: hypothetical protein UX01_C0005G0022 [Candidatus Collierbacteria bacterium GW2011_GWB2_45_17]KKU05797.1 MAG: hypothetical protein UX08_C0002G0012 [Candidatus Collierbacte
MAGIIITRPNHDQITTYISLWSEAVILFAKTKGHSIFDLFSKKADRKSLEQYLTTNNLSFLFLNGHGSSDEICGYNDEVLLDDETQPTLILGLIIYARSCNAGENLGQILVTKGVKAFIGYTKSFSFATSNKFVFRPKEDPLARLFLEPSNLVATTIIKGNTVQEAHQRSVLEMRKTLSEMILSNIPNKKDYAFALYNNMLGQTVIGDGQAKI